MCSEVIPTLADIFCLGGLEITSMHWTYWLTKGQCVCFLDRHTTKIQISYHKYRRISKIFQEYKWNNECWGTAMDVQKFQDKLKLWNGTDRNIMALIKSMTKINLKCKVPSLHGNWNISHHASKWLMIMYSGLHDSVDTRKLLYALK